MTPYLKWYLRTKNIHQFDGNILNQISFWNSVTYWYKWNKHVQCKFFTKCNCIGQKYVWCNTSPIQSHTFIMYQSMMTSSNGNFFRVTGPLCGEFTGPGEFPAQRPVKRSFDVFFDLRLIKRLNKQAWGWWFDTPSWSLWRQCNVNRTILSAKSTNSCGI